MARHEVIIHENAGATAENAPYLGSYIAKETVPQSAFVESVAAKCGLPAIQVAAIIDGSFETIEELERAGLVRVHTDLGTVCGVIRGSFPTADAEFDPERNALELALWLDDSIRLDLADVVPKIVTDETLTKLRVDNVMDLEEERPMNLIHGRHVFRVAGFNMVLSDQDATVFLENGIGTTFPVVVDEVVSKQLFKAHTAELIPAGDYKLVVKSRAGDAAGPLQTAFRRVKYLRVEDPVGPEVRLVSVNGGEDVPCDSSSCTIEGENLTILPGDTVTAEAELEETRKSFEVSVVAESSTASVLTLSYASDAMDEMTGGGVTFTVHSRGGVATAAFQTKTITASICASH